MSTVAPDGRNPYHVDSTVTVGAGIPGPDLARLIAATIPGDDADGSPVVEYLPGRYDRLNLCAKEYASGTDFGDGFWTGDMVIALAVNLTAARVLDGLTEHDANTVSMLTILDVARGFRHMVWRMADWLSDKRTVDREDDDEAAVLSVLARVLAITAAAFVGEEFEKAQRIYPDDDTVVTP